MSKQSEHLKPSYLAESREEEKMETDQPYKDSNPVRHFNNLFETCSKKEAIHDLMILDNKGFNEIAGFNFKYRNHKECYQKSLLEVSSSKTNSEGLKLFSLDPQYLSNFNSFYYLTYKERLVALKAFEEFYKTKAAQIDSATVEENDPVAMQNTNLKFFIEAVRKALILSNLPHFLVNLIRSKSEIGMIDEEVVEFSLQCLSVLMDVREDHDSHKTLMQKLSGHKEFLDTYIKTSEHQKFNRAYSRFMSSQGAAADLINEGTQEQADLKAKHKEETKRKLDKRKQDIMKKMNAKRKKLATEYVQPEADSLMEETKLVSEEDSKNQHEWKCHYCQEELTLEDFEDATKPFGYVAEVGNSRLRLNLFEKQVQTELEQLVETSKDSGISESALDEFKTNLTAIMNNF